MILVIRGWSVGLVLVDQGLYLTTYVRTFTLYSIGLGKKRGVGIRRPTQALSLSLSLRLSLYLEGRVCVCGLADFIGGGGGFLYTACAEILGHRREELYQQIFLI